ncbi:MAG: hypothetical protein H6586_02200 [Flavobacteriales bacterium]|nr:hypothetical protein [Flavobacteriales bacterium]
MRYFLTILIAFLISQSCFGQNKKPIDLGIGFVISSNPYKYYDGSHYESFYTNENLNNKWKGDKIFPFFYKPDYGLYHFICLEKSNNYYKILINDSSIAYLPNDTNFYFKTWDSMITNSTFERVSRENHIYTESNTKSQIINNPCEFDKLKVEDIIEKNGEYWAYIWFSIDCETYPEKEGKEIYGWVKWRTKNKLLVEILLLC